MMRAVFVPSIVASSTPKGRATAEAAAADLAIEILIKEEHSRQLDAEIAAKQSELDAKAGLRQTVDLK